MYYRIDAVAAPTRYPPSTYTTCPVMNLASSEARKAITLEMSSTSAIRPRGIAALSFSIATTPGLTPEKRTVQIDIDEVTPVIFGHFQGGVRADDSSGIHQHIHATEFRCRVVGHGKTFRLLPDIDLKNTDPLRRVFFTHPAGGFRCVFKIHIRQQDIRAPRRQ